MSTMAAEGGEQIDPFGMAPWTPEPAPECLNMPQMQNPRNIYLSSEDYIAVLESKLNKISRGNTNGKVVTPKDMIRCLSQTKETQMKTLTDASQDPYISNHEYSCEEQESRLAAIHRRLYPERQALYPEELKTLVDNDILGKVVLEMKAKEHDMEEQAWKRRLSQPHSFTETSSGSPSIKDHQTSPHTLPKLSTSKKEQMAIEPKEVNTAEPPGARNKQPGSHITLGKKPAKDTEAKAPATAKDKDPERGASLKTTADDKTTPIPGGATIAESKVTTKVKEELATACKKADTTLAELEDPKSGENKDTSGSKPEGAVGGIDTDTTMSKPDTTTTTHTTSQPTDKAKEATQADRVSDENAQLIDN